MFADFCGQRIPRVCVDSDTFVFCYFASEPVSRFLLLKNVSNFDLVTPDVFVLSHKALFCFLYFFKPNDGLLHLHQHLSGHDIELYT